MKFRSLIVRLYFSAVSDDFILVDDNTRPHHARIVIGTIGRIDCPPKGINPIEHLWDILQRRN